MFQLLSPFGMLDLEQVSVMIVDFDFAHTNLFPKSPYISELQQDQICGGPTPTQPCDC